MYLSFLCFFFFWLAVQNLILPWMYRQHLLGAVTIGLLMAAKEVALALALLTLARRFWSKEWRLLMPDKFAFAYAVLLTIYLFCGPWLLGGTATFTLRLISMRGLVSLALFYFWGRLSFLDLRQLRRLACFVVGLQVAVALFGIYEWSFLPASFWSDTVGAGTFMLDVKGLLNNQNVVNGLPSNMFMFGIRREISSYGDPLAMGIASVFPFLVCVAWLLHNSKMRNAAGGRIVWQLTAVVIGVALVLTIGRESIGAAALGVLALLFWCGRLRQTLFVVVLACVALLFLPQVWKYVSDTVTFREASAATHLRFLHTGWEEIPSMVAGKGLGEAGGWAFSLAGVKSDVGENSYFELMSQTGLLSVILLVLFLFGVARAGLGYSYRFYDPLISAAFLAAAAHIFARCLAGIFSPSLFGVIPLASFFFFCGAGFTAVQRATAKPVAVARRVLILKSKDGIHPRTWLPTAAE
jgi:hypothetical protein